MSTSYSRPMVTRCGLPPAEGVLLIDISPLIDISLSLMDPNSSVHLEADDPGKDCLAAGRRRRVDRQPGRELGRTPYRRAQRGVPARAKASATAGTTT